MSETSEWAKQESRKIIAEFEPTTDKPGMGKAIALALDAARAVQPGCVRLPDGREPRVLGTLPMTADGVIVIPGADPGLIWNQYQRSIHAPLVCREDGKWGGYFGEQWRFVEDCYSTSAAAEAAAKEGKTP